MTSLVCPKSGEYYKGMDKVSKEKRSEIMRRVRSKDSKIEQQLRALLADKGLRFRTNVSGLQGKPDIVFSRLKVAIFVDSCFWHGCVKHCRVPKNNQQYWETKISRNRKRDKAINQVYRKSGWRVLRVWEHSLNK